MELYLDSVNFKEIEEASKLGYLTGLTTTPTFMFREGIKDVDAAMVKLAGMVDILQVEALGNNADEVVAEAERLISIGLPSNRTVFKIPVSLEGTRACRILVNKGYMVNLHLVYTLQQAYMSFAAGATYVCPLVGRLQDQGHDALGLVDQCVDVVEKYGYQSKVMFSSVRYVEHIKNALNLGVHACTVPWKVMKQLTENHFTDIGTRQFEEHTYLITSKVITKTRTDDVFMDSGQKVLDALITMSRSKTGAVLVMKDKSLHRIFTDGDLRRLLQEKGNDLLQMKLSELPSNAPLSISATDTLQDALELVKKEKLDCLMVMEEGRPLGIIDIQDII